ncbi:MAG: YigZ family protein [Eubacteriales bacterium]
MTGDAYRSLRQAAAATHTVKKSVFIAQATPVDTEQAALSFIKSVKQQYPDAKHHVYAYVLRENHTVRYSDDREPQGTAGLPVLAAIQKQQLFDCAVVVSRYFGGVLLGTGGLVHAYAAAAKEALSLAGTITYDTYSYLHIVCTYPDYQKLLAPLSLPFVHRESESFAEQVALLVSLPAAEEAAFLETLREVTAARATVTLQKRSFDCR